MQTDSIIHKTLTQAPFTTPRQIGLLKAALGVERQATSCRNELFAEIDSTDYRDCRALVDRDLMKGGFTTHAPNVQVFRATENGKALILGARAR
jgi:hypothetical protein